VSPSNELAEWVAKQLARRGKGRLVRLALRHLGASKQASGDVEGVDVPEDTDAGWVESTSTWLFTAAQADARALTGANESYVVLAFFEKDASMPAARHSMRVRGGADADMEDDSDPLSSEPATSEGALAQMMRHNEVLMKMATQGSMRTIEALTRQLGTVTATNERMQAQRLEGIQAMEDLAQRKHERDIEARIIEATEQRKDELVGMAMPLIPMLANKLAGVKLLPGGIETGDGVRALLASITPDQVEKLFPILHPTQQTLLGTMFQEFKAEAEAREAKAAEERKAREGAH
jgi:hypothetical protein